MDRTAEGPRLAGGGLPTFEPSAGGHWIEADSVVAEKAARPVAAAFRRIA
jgi:hypothetical protein